MHDPSTVAFDIKSPFRGKPSSMWPKGYRNTLITIWHEDPLHFEGKCGCKRDDSCGWFSPPYSPEDRSRIRKLGESQYSTIFGKQDALARGADYARVCYEPSVYDAIYWAWRAIKHSERKGSGWQYGKALSAAELNEIYGLASNPVNNLRWTVCEVKDAEGCAGFFLTVYRCYLRFNRPWYKHPRWHFWHWRFQIHIWQIFRRWAFSRCAGCGKGFTWGYSPTGFQWHSPKPKWFCSEVDVYHSECAGMTAALHKEPAQGTA